jgi:2-methylfumaryl-CoA isomerase
MFAEVDQPGIGTYLVPRSPLDVGDLNVPVAPAPLLGQHTEEVLADLLNLSSNEIGQLFDAGLAAPATEFTPTG